MAGEDTAAAEAHGGPHGAAADGEGGPRTGLRDKVAAQKGKMTDRKARLRDKTRPPGGYDPTPRPRGAPGYTVRFTFHRAQDLPVADLGSSSSDPFVRATLTTPPGTPKRHKEDPDLVHRTRTVHRSTAPVWDEDWVVANVPAAGFRLKCRLYDEDAADHDDRLGNVTYEVGRLDGGDDHAWSVLDHQTLPIQRRMGSKRAYLLQAAAAVVHGARITPTLELSVRVLGRSDPPGGPVYTLGPTTWVRHFSPMIGRLTHTRVNKDERADETTDGPGEEKQTKKYDFQANEIQLQGPVPARLCHRYVEFRPIIGRMFSSHGLRGRILNKALHKQHSRVYNYSRSTEYGTFAPCSEQASLQFLRLAHFAEGGRVFTYMVSLDGVFRFTETGKEFGIDLLSKHTMHADVATYIAFSGEFFVRRLARPGPASSGGSGGSSDPPPPYQPGYYQLIIDNDSGTYRPEKALLPELRAFLERQFPGLGVVALHWEDETLQAMKKEQLAIKKREGPGVRMVANRSPSARSLSSSDESRLSDLAHDDDGGGGSNGTPRRHKRRTKKEVAWDLLEDPSRIKDLHSVLHEPAGEASAARG